ncbi:MAG: PKD domain-containing protein [Bacteroidia bacterium]
MKKIFALCLLYFLNLIAFGQCNAAFTFTVSGDTIRLTDASTYTSPVNYEWAFYNDNCGITGWYSSSPLPVTTNAGDHNVCLTISGSSGCNSTTCHTITVVNGFHKPCDASFSSWKDSSVLHPVYFGSNSSCDSEKWMWDFGDGNYDTTFNAITSHIYAIQGTYSVCVKTISLAGDTCSYCDTVNSAPICPPSVTFLLNKDSLQPNTWDVYPTYSSNVNRAKWDWGDGASSFGLYPNHNYSTAGWYNLCVTAYSSCGDSVVFCQNDSVYRQTSSNSVVTVNVVGGSSTISIAQTKKNNVINIYPNPANNQFFIETNGTEILVIEMYDINGRHVQCIKDKNKSNIDISGLDEGMYTVTIKTINGSVNRKLVIVR